MSRRSFTRNEVERLSDLGGRTAGVQYFLDDIYLYVTIQSTTKLPNSAANTSLLHFPPIQHLMHHLGEAVTETVVLNGLYFHTAQTQSPCTSLPFFTDVVPQYVQVTLGHGIVL